MKGDAPLMKSNSCKKTMLTEHIPEKVFHACWWEPHGVDDQVCAQIASCLRAAPAAFLPTTHEESASDDDVPATIKRNGT